MNTHWEKKFLVQPRVLILIGVLLIISSLTGNKLLSFLFSLIVSLSILSHYYLKYFQNKVSWSFKKYVDLSSVDEQIQGYIEVKNESALPIYNFKLTIESKSDNHLVFFNHSNDSAGSSMFSQTVFLPPKSQKIIELRLKGKNRGTQRWTNLDIHLSDPLSLQTLRLNYPHEKNPSFKIVPRIIKLKDLTLKSLLQGYKNTNHSLFMDESSIIGTKEYENESFRHIHWLASAKENKLLAKKYQKVHGNIYSVFLNLVGNGPFHLRKDMEELIEYTVSVCLYLIKEGCKVELIVNYLTEEKGLLKLENDIDRAQLKTIIEALSMVDENGMFLSNEQFYQQGFAKMDSKSLALVIGTPPPPMKHKKWLHIKK
jgi:uncharacterized protein (DUF58 family)